MLRKTRCTGIKSTRPALSTTTTIGMCCLLPPSTSVSHYRHQQVSVVNQLPTPLLAPTLLRGWRLNTARIPHRMTPSHPTPNSNHPSGCFSAAAGPSHACIAASSPPTLVPAPYQVLHLMTTAPTRAMTAAFTAPASKLDPHQQPTPSVGPPSTRSDPGSVAHQVPDAHQVE